MKNEQQKHIRVLADQVINKIAAGEVVENPASVIKELVENALDARASTIDIEITAGGKRLIAVSDNGLGMDRNDALLSIERHATSKIRDVEDIERIGTLGFRGEALAAISSVSRFALRTRRASDLAGTELLMAGGKMQEVREAGCPPGTTVEVRNLFFNVPARRKFLRSEQTECARVRQVFMMYALANPAVGMRLKIDGRTLHNLPANAAGKDRLLELFRSIPKDALRPVAYTSPDIKVSGFAALPSLSRSDRSEQCIFINCRPAWAPVLSGAISEGYHSLLPRNRHPVLFLFIGIAPELVDVNVHPAKKEVRFHSPGAVRAAVAQAIRTALQNTAARSIFAPNPPGGDLQMPPPRSGSAAPTGLFTYGGSAFKKRPAPASDAAPLLPGAAGTAAAPAANAGKPWNWCRVIGQIGNLYVVLETEDGLVLMDQHAAHERVLFEKYTAAISGRAVESQALLAAETVVLTPADALNLRKSLAALKQAGFGIHEFGQDTFLVDALPACLGDISAGRLVAEIAPALAEGAGSVELIMEQIAKAACHAAVKARARLTESEIGRLITDLEKAEMPYTCPHGRPVIIHFSFQDLARKFGRSAPRAESGANARG
ncbi:MAG: DNA mismatch repair endonuclease MutL [Kiritimatiellia bacterium]